MELFAAALVVFAITLTVNKSKLFACKRKFVEERYQSAKINGKPSFIHTVWRAWWTCPMCFGFWVSLLVCIFFRTYWYGFDVLIVYGLNWLLHCFESALFHFGKFFEILLDEKKDMV